MGVDKVRIDVVGGYQVTLLATSNYWYQGYYVPVMITKHWIQSPWTQTPKDPKSWRPCCTFAVTVHLYKQSVPMLQPQIHGFVLYIVAMHQRPLFWADNAISNHPPTSLIFSVVLSVLRIHTCTHKARESWDYILCMWPFDLGTSVHTASHDSSLASSKGEYSCVLWRKDKEG